MIRLRPALLLALTCALLAARGVTASAQGPSCTDKFELNQNQLSLLGVDVHPGRVCSSPAQMSFRR